MKHLTILLACVALGGCATVQGGFARAGKAMCDSADTLRQSYTLALLNAPLIEDQAARETTIAIATAGLNALAACPVEVAVAP